MNAVSGRKFPTINPTNGKVIAEISEGDKVKFIDYITKNIRTEEQKNTDKIDRELIEIQ